MGGVTFDYLGTINLAYRAFFGTFSSYLQDYLPKLLQLKQAYLACTSLLLIIGVANFVLNLFNYGDSVTQTQTEMSTITAIFHYIYFAIWVLEVILYLGFLAVTICFHVYGLVFYLEQGFAAAMVIILLIFFLYNNKFLS